MSRTKSTGLQNEVDYHAALGRMSVLWDLDRTAAEDQELERLASQVAEWERRDGTLSTSTSQVKRRSVLENLMEHRGLKPSDFTDVCGGLDCVQEILSGKGTMSDADARKVAERFGLPWSLFEASIQP